MSETSFAIIGPGAAAEHHVHAIRANEDRGARLAAVGYYDPDRFEAIEERFGTPCRSFEDVLARSDVDAVCICTPSGQHAEQAIAAARAGKHVLVEKPMALTLEGADRMIAACEDAGVQLGVVYQRRAEPKFRRIRNAIESGELGTVTLATAVLPYQRDQAYYEQAPWRGTWAQDGGGVLMNQGIHFVDLMVWYMGDPTGAYAHADTLLRRIEVEDVLTASLQFANGAVATIAATTTADPPFSHRLELYGTEGSIRVEGETVRQWTGDGDQQEVAPASSADGRTGAAGDPDAIDRSGHIHLVRDFIESIRNQSAPLVDGREGRRSLQAVLDIYAAARIGGRKDASTR